MSKLDYLPISLNEEMINDFETIYLQPEIYHVSSIYYYEPLKNDFINLRANIADLNPALIVKCIQGTEQDFVMLMEKAREFLDSTYDGPDAAKEKLLMMFSDCIFGYYFLTPLMEAEEISDIKIYSWNHITCKANGKRYLTDLSFYSPDDYENWYKRRLRIYGLGYGVEHSLQHNTDTKGVNNFLMRVDVELSHIVSTGENVIHFRKLPKVKYTWQYLKDNKMLDDDIIFYIKDRIVSGYGFLISGRGGSGKSTLLNNMIDLIPFNESILVSQESDELYSNVHPQIQFEHTLEVGRRAEEKVEYTLDEELRIGLLQDIDNFVIGEIKGSEALYVFTTALSTGARFFGTIHANNAKDSTRRLAQCAKYISDYSVPALQEMLTATPFCLIHMSHFSIDEIVEVAGWDASNECLIYKDVYKKIVPISEVLKRKKKMVSDTVVSETLNIPANMSNMPVESVEVGKGWNKSSLDDYKNAVSGFYFNN